MKYGEKEYTLHGAVSLFLKENLHFRSDNLLVQKI